MPAEHNETTRPKSSQHSDKNLVLSEARLEPPDVNAFNTARPEQGRLSSPPLREALATE
jgi:hypothetical protein